MSKTSIALLSVALVLVAIPMAVADETKADCEPGQNWAGYSETDSARALYHSIFVTGTDPTVDNCEGEHWDGQDSVQSANNPSPPGSGCGPAVSSDLNTVASCAHWDSAQNSPSPDPTVNGRVLDFRVSVKKLDNGAEVYVLTDIAVVGRAALYSGTCNGGQGLEGATSCNGQLQQRTAIFLKDNTPGELLATVVSAVGLTKGHAADGDCDQATYQRGADTGNRQLCGRDNTAITVDTLLP